MFIKLIVVFPDLESIGSSNAVPEIAHLPQRTDFQLRGLALRQGEVCTRKQPSVEWAPLHALRANDLIDFE